jgi:hypothetical protein
MNTPDVKKELLQIRAASVDGRIAIVDLEELADEVAELVERSHAAPGAQQRERFTKGERDLLQALPYAVLSHLLKRVELRLLDIETRATAGVQIAAAPAPALDVERLADVIVPVVKAYVDQRLAELAAAPK